MAAEVVKKLEAATDYVCVTFVQNCSKQQVGWWVGICMQQVAVDSSARSLAVQGSLNHRASCKLSIKLLQQFDSGLACKCL